MARLKTAWKNMLCTHIPAALGKLLTYISTSAKGDSLNKNPFFIYPRSSLTLTYLKADNILVKLYHIPDTGDRG